MVTTTSPPPSSSPLPQGLSLKPPSSVSPKSSRKSFKSVSDNPRSSIVSTSAGSYATAILDGTPTPSANENTSAAHPPNTLSLQPTSVNPMHILATAQLNGDSNAEIHIREVTEDTVVLVGDQDTSLKSKLSHLGRTIVDSVDNSAHINTSDAIAATAAGSDLLSEKEIVGSQRTITNPQTRIPMLLPNGYIAPPSPPSSESLTDENGPAFGPQLTEEPLSTDDNITMMGLPRDEQLSQPISNSPPVSYPGPSRAPMTVRSYTSVDLRRPDDATSLDSLGSSPRTIGSAPHSQDKTPSKMSIPPPRMNNGSMNTITGPIPSSPERGVGQDNSHASTSSLPMQRPAQLPTVPLVDSSNHLHPSSAAVSPWKTTRRNTTGSVFRPGHRKAQSLNLDSNRVADDMAAPDLSLPSASTLTPALLDPDILREAEQIRRERTKRVKVQDGVAAVPHPSTGGAAGAVAFGVPHPIPSWRGKEEDDNKPLVGNLIGEDHANYVLMYNMLTGIRIGVSRCVAKMKRTLGPQDYAARHKYTFDIIGNELTPSAKYDFKFKDYAPWVFRDLREECFHLDPADYLLSLTSQYILSELGSPGKSGSFFYFSRDYRFIIKTIHHNEHKFLCKILPDYFEHVKTNPHTLLSRFYGLHRVKLPRGRKIHFVIMNNLFPPHRDVHETFDLKGSTVGREYPEEKTQNNPRAVLKDLNWINRGRQLELGPEKRALLIEQLRRDSELLKRLNVMDYSLLVGIHNMQRGNRDNLRRNTLRVFQPDVLQHLARRRRASLSGKETASEASVIRRLMRQSDPQAIGTTQASMLPDMDSTDRRHFIFHQDEGGFRATDESNRPMGTIYYLGIIDILTPYTTFKKLEHAWKGLHADRHKISPVPAQEYGNRFFGFLKAVIRGGGGAQSFK